MDKKDYALISAFMVFYITAYFIGYQLLGFACMTIAAIFWMYMFYTANQIIKEQDGIIDLYQRANAKRNRL